METPPRIIICGAPASGKGTQCEFIKEEFKVVHLSTGDMLRAAATAGTAMGLEAKAFMDKGELVPDSTMIGIILDRLKESDCEKQGWLLDGFPRTGVQADALLQAGVQCDILILLDVPDSLLVERVVGRRSDPVTGKIYHMKYSRPTDPAILQRLVHRSDDTEEKVLVRLAAYHKNLSSILDKYSDRTHRCVVQTNENSPSVYWKGIRSQIIRSRKLKVAFILGGPGCGKGTVCKRIESEFGYVHLSAGDLLREEITLGGELADTIKKITLAGGIVPAHITVNLLQKAMLASPIKKFLVDGFPRNAENLNKWNEVMSNIAVVDFALYLECDETTMKARLLERGKTSGRADDNNETIIQRFRTFYLDSITVLDSLHRAGKVRTINARVPAGAVFEQAARLFRGLALSPPLSRTFGMVKPDAVSLGHVPAILEMIHNAGLNVVMSKLIYMNASVASQFYAEHTLKNFFPNLRQFMTSGPSLALVLEGEDAVAEWRALLGPTDPAVALQKAPDSIRAKFGTDGTRNACHGSDSVFSAIREIDFWSESGPGANFELSNLHNTIIQAATISTQPVTSASIGGAADDAAAASVNAKKGKHPTPAAPLVHDEKPTGAETALSMVVRIEPYGLPVENTFAIIKPTTADNYYQEVMSMVAVHGFEVVSETRTRLTPQLAEGFYAEHRGKPFFGQLIDYMTSGSVVVLHLRRAGAITCWRTLIGPTDSFKASAFAPFSIRGKFGVDNTRNAVHGSDSAASANREIDYFFSFGLSGAGAHHHHHHHGLSSTSARSSGSSSSASVQPRPLPLPSMADSPMNLVPRHARKVQQLPSINRKDIAVMSKYAYENVDPIMQVLMRRLLVERPSSMADFCLAEMNSIASQVKLDPIPTNGDSGGSSPNGGGLKGSASSPTLRNGKQGRQYQQFDSDGESLGATAGEGDDLSVSSYTRY